MKINSKNVIKLGLSVLVLAASITVTQVFAIDRVGSVSDRLGRFANIDIPQRDLAEKKRYINKNQNVQSRDEVTGLAIADETNPLSSSSIELTPIDQLVGIEGQQSTIFGESTDVDFRLYGQANLQRLQVLQDSAYDRLTVGYTDPRLAFGSPADLSVQGGIKIAALADTSRTGLDRVCADDWGVLTVCDDASVTDPTSPVLTYSWNTVWGACGGSAGAETCTGNRYEPYKRMPLEFDQTPFREDQIDWSPGEYFDVTGGVEDGWVSLGFDLQIACTESNQFVQAPSTNTPHPDRKWTYFDGNTDSSGDCDPVVGTPYWGYLDSYDPQTAYEQWDIDRVAWRVAEDETPLSCNENNPTTESQCLANNVFPADNCAWGPSSAAGSCSGNYSSQPYKINALDNDIARRFDWVPGVVYYHNESSSSDAFVDLVPFFPEDDLDGNYVGDQCVVGRTYYSVLEDGFSGDIFEYSDTFSYLGSDQIDQYYWYEMTAVDVPLDPITGNDVPSDIGCHIGVPESEVSDNRHLVGQKSDYPAWSRNYSCSGETESQCLQNNNVSTDSCSWDNAGSTQSGSTQSATITCQDQNGNIVSDDLCTEPRPATSRSCGQSCNGTFTRYNCTVAFNVINSSSVSASSTAQFSSYTSEGCSRQMGQFQADNINLYDNFVQSNIREATGQACSQFTDEPACAPSSCTWE